MSGVDVLVITGALALIALLTWFFFGPKTVRSAVLQGGMHQGQGWARKSSTR